MNLNETQLAALKKVANAEIRTPEQMLSLLLAEGITFYYADYCSPFAKINEIELANQLTEDAKSQISEL